MFGHIGLKNDICRVDLLFINLKKYLVMKKTLLLLAFFLVSMVSFAQEDITQQAKDYRTAMMSFLKSEGFSPSITEKGNLMIKREGIAYWITFTDEDPVYIEFHREGLDGEGVNLGALHLAVNDLNYNRRCVKAVIDDNDLIVHVSWDARNSRAHSIVTSRR